MFSQVTWFCISGCLALGEFITPLWPFQVTQDPFCIVPLCTLICSSIFLALLDIDVFICLHCAHQILSEMFPSLILEETSFFLTVSSLFLCYCLPAGCFLISCYSLNPGFTVDIFPFFSLFLSYLWSPVDKLLFLSLFFWMAWSSPPVQKCHPCSFRYSSSFGMKSLELRSLISNCMGIWLGHLEWFSKLPTFSFKSLNFCSWILHFQLKKEYNHVILCWLVFVQSMCRMPLLNGRGCLRRDQCFLAKIISLCLVSFCIPRLIFHYHRYLWLYFAFQFHDRRDIFLLSVSSRSSCSSSYPSFRFCWQRPPAAVEAWFDFEWEDPENGKRLSTPVFARNPCNSQVHGVAKSWDTYWSIFNFHSSENVFSCSIPSCCNHYLFRCWQKLGFPLPVAAPSVSSILLKYISQLSEDHCCRVKTQCLYTRANCQLFRCLRSERSKFQGYCTIFANGWQMTQWSSPRVMFGG